METEIATQQGANEAVNPENAVQGQQQTSGTSEQQTATEEQQRPKSARELAMESIQQRVDEERGVPTPAEEVQQQTDNTQQQQAAAVPQQDRPAERMLKVKIDGVEKEVPESEVIRNYQIEQAARGRLEEATTLLKEVRDLKQQVATPQAQQQTATTTDDDGTQTGIPDEVLEKAKGIVEGIAEGDLTSAAETLAKVLAEKTPQPSVDETAINQIVERQMTAKEFNADFVRAKEMFDQNYADINSNPRLSQICNSIYYEHVQAGKRPSEAAELAGEEVRKLVSPPAQSQTLNVQNRQERKQGIDTIRPAAAITTASAEEATPADASSVIAEMKRLRGQT